MLLNVLYLGILSDMESMDTVVLAVVTAAVADTAACDDGDVTVRTYKKVVINALFMAGFADDNRDVAGLVLSAVLEVDVDAVPSPDSLDSIWIFAVEHLPSLLPLLLILKAPTGRLSNSATSLSILFSSSSIARHPLLTICTVASASAPHIKFIHDFR